MNIELINSISEKSLNGEISFPALVKALIDEGIDFYHVDLVNIETKYYSNTNECYVKPFEYAAATMLNHFDADEVVAAIRASQQGQITYKQFLDKIIRAGTYYYIACLAGKKVIYLGKSGEMHVENFPTAK